MCCAFVYTIDGGFIKDCGNLYSDPLITPRPCDGCISAEYAGGATRPHRGSLADAAVLCLSCVVDAARRRMLGLPALAFDAQSFRLNQA